MKFLTDITNLINRIVKKFSDSCNRKEQETKCQDNIDQGGTITLTSYSKEQMLENLPYHLFVLFIIFKTTFQQQASHLQFVTTLHSSPKRKSKRVT
jgi:hypothetical protein